MWAHKLFLRFFIDCGKIASHRIDKSCVRALQFIVRAVIVGLRLCLKTDRLKDIGRGSDAVIIFYTVKPDILLRLRKRVFCDSKFFDRVLYA